MTPVWHTATGVSARWPCEIVIPGEGVRTTASWTPYFVISLPALSEGERIWVDYAQVEERLPAGCNPLIRWGVRYCYAPEGWAPGPAAMAETPRSLYDELWLASLRR